MKKRTLIFFTAAVLSSVLLARGLTQISNLPTEPVAVDPSTGVTVVAQTIASGLVVPWSLVFDPDGRLFVTERPGRVRVIINDTLLTQPVIDMTGVVAHAGEGGLCGITLDQDFAANHYLYVYHTYREGGLLKNRVVRLIENNNRATIDTVLLAGIPGQSIHDGGQIKVGPDNLLYVTTGDASVPDNAQRLSSLSGKILRMNLDGSAPADNPFPDEAPLVYSYGHRNPQGLAWDSSGQLYETEHGPSGELGARSNDEVNIIYPGVNYGWPNCIGICGDPNYMDPIRLFFPETVPPHGATFYYGDQLPMWTGSFFFGTSGFNFNPAARHIHRLLFDQLGGTTIVEEARLAQDQFRRIRDMIAGSDGFLYFTTSNRDGRATPLAGDDRVIRLRPQ
ncbi:MAG: PQQ-dependent sugar dehydrogenase [Acidobacteria bacterium]|nr:PQQ-dependent sugar dehydrogenase [Acidobacteriota bacterium]MBI3655728.1 PQQ-dependent sugar dehydrogenase [Acidobacteriota bacterium]